MILAQLTDTHIKSNRRKAYGRVDTAAMLDAAVKHINAFEPAIDVVLVSGDLTDRGEPEEFYALRESLKNISMPWHVIPGNHDDRCNFLEAFADHDYLEDSASFIHYIIDDYPLQLIGLDTTVDEKPYGFLPAKRLEWLDACLASEPEKPTLLFMHHPPFKTGIHHMDVQNLLNADELFTLLEQHSQVLHIACGHVHRASETCVNGIGVSIAPNAAHSSTLNFDPKGASTFIIEPPAIRLFRFDDDNGLVSHLSYIGDFDGPYPYFNADGSLVD